MPANPNRLSRSLRVDEKKLKELSQDYFAGVSEAPQPSPPVIRNTKFGRLADAVYNQFISQPTFKALPAIIFTEQLLEGVSPTTVSKIKKLMGIRSIRRQDVWYWSFPQRAPDKGRAEIHKRMLMEQNPYLHELERRQRPAVKELQTIMERYNYVISNFEGFNLMRKAGYQRSTTMVAKSVLRVSSVKINGLWYWLWPGPVVVEWLNNKLSAGPRYLAELDKEAMDEYQWPERMLNLAKEAMGGVQFDFQHGKIRWFNINKSTPVPQPVEDTSVEPDILPENIVEVDFSEPVTADVEEFSDNYDPGESETITVNGIKMEVFK